MNHPPAMGGKTAWGVRELMATGLSDDPEEVNKIKAAASDFARREEERLKRLHNMEGTAERILEDRKARRNVFDPTVSKTEDAEEVRRKQDEVLRRMQDAKEAKRLAKKQQREQDGVVGKKKKKQQKKKEESESSSSSSDASSSSSSSSSSSGSKKKKKEKKDKKDKKEKVLFEVRLDQLPEAVIEKKPVEKPSPEQEAELKRKAAEARLREREVKKKAKEQAAAWAAEVKMKEAEAEMKRKVEAKKREEEAQAKRKAEEEAKKKTAEEEAKKKAEEAEAKNAAPAEERKKLFSVGTKREGKKAGPGGDRSKPVIGGYFEGQTVYASKDITVRGNLVVKRGCSGTINGPSETNPGQRIAVEFAKREDRLVGCLNCVPADIKKTR